MEHGKLDYSTSPEHILGVGVNEHTLGVADLDLKTLKV